DASIDGLDEAILNGALGTSTGDAGFVDAADWNRDGTISVEDRAYYDAGFGFTANQAPVVTASSFEVIGGSTIQIDFSEQASDPDGDRLFFLVDDVIGGTIRLINGGQAAIFTPETGFSGSASFTLITDDGALRSDPQSVTIDVTQVEFTGYRIEGADSVVGVGETLRLRLFGDYDGGSIELESPSFSVSSRDASIASVDIDGTVLGLSAGRSVIEFQLKNGGVVAAAVNIGQPDSRLLDFFPLSYALIPGQTRQMLIRERVNDEVVQRESAEDGTFYFVSDPSIATISEDGLLTALQAGKVTVTIVNGGQSVRVTMVISDPMANGSKVGQEGGVVFNGDYGVGIPVGALEGEATVNVTPLDESDLPLSMPDGFNFYGGINVDWGDTLTNSPLSIAMPAPAGSTPGEEVFLFQPVT
ncbi:MAG: Ig-like domain-containing protein, partial [Verrucomicrobiae bacterium]|nr:Ig-like domain-containing protein [Verrucomicrobiae bacterium]